MSQSLEKLNEEWVDWLFALRPARYHSSINAARRAVERALTDTIPRATVAVALEELRDELVIDTAASWADGTLSPKGRGIEAARIKLDATIAALGLSGTEETK